MAWMLQPHNWRQAVRPNLYNVGYGRTLAYKGMGALGQRVPIPIHIQPKAASIPTCSYVDQVDCLSPSGNYMSSSCGDLVPCIPPLPPSYPITMTYYPSGQIMYGTPATTTTIMTATAPNYLPLLLAVAAAGFLVGGFRG